MEKRCFTGVVTNGIRDELCSLCILEFVGSIQHGIICWVCILSSANCWRYLSAVVD